MSRCLLLLLIALSACDAQPQAAKTAKTEKTKTTKKTRPQFGGKGLLEVAQDSVKRKTQIAVARAQIESIKAALANYRSDQGRYPRLQPRPAAADPAGLADDAPALYGGIMNKPTMATGGGQNGPYIEGWNSERVGVLTPKGHRPLTAAEADALQTLELQTKHAPTTAQPLVLLDPWGNPYHYREWASVRQAVKEAMFKTPVQRRVQGKTIPDVPHFLESFDVWSNGPDGVNDYGAKGSDDVASWRDR